MNELVETVETDYSLAILIPCASTVYLAIYWCEWKHELTYVIV